MNIQILTTEVNYAVSLLRESFFLLDKFGSGDSSESALCFCLYNGIERLLKIGIAIEKGEVVRGHKILDLYKDFLGDEHYNDISRPIGERSEFKYKGPPITINPGETLNLTTLIFNSPSKKTVKDKPEFLLLSQIDEFANSKGRYKNLDNLFNTQAEPFIYLEKLATESMRDASGEASYGKETYVYDYGDINIRRIKIVKITLCNLLKSIKEKYTQILENKNEDIRLSTNSFLEFVED